jgi:hypothetical protein
MATAEIVRDASTSFIRSAAPITGDVIQGSTLFRGVVRSFSALLYGSIAASSTLAANEKNSVAWDRLNLELMRIAGMKANWDGEGAEQVSQMAVNNAAVLLFLAKAAILRSINPQCPVPSMIPAVDGGVILKWVTASKELKCTVRADFVEVVRWKSRDRYESDGFWEIPVHQVAEHVEWLLR